MTTSISPTVQKSLDAHAMANQQMKDRFNKSGLRPLGKAVLVKVYEVTKRDSLIEIPDIVKDRQRLVETRAVVIAVGDSCWDDEPNPRAKPGDKVLIARLAGVMVEGTADGEMYRMVNDRDIYCAIEVDSHEC